MHSLTIIPSYKCNAQCEYCYTNSYKGRFKHDMDFFTFLDLVNKFIKDGGKSVQFIGGEPTIWKHLNKAILYCKLRGLRTTIITNGLRVPKIVPHKVSLSIGHYFEPQKKALVESTLRYYRDKKVRISFRYNFSIYGDDNDSEVEEVIRLAKEYNVAYIDIVPIVPYEFKRELGIKVFSLVKKVKENNINCILGNPLPICIFEDSEITYLKKAAKLFFVCDIGQHVLVNPDGVTIQPCTKVFLPKNISDLKGSFKNSQNIYAADRDALINKSVPEKCKGCDYLKNKQCMGGCLGKATMNNYRGINQ